MRNGAHTHAVTLLQDSPNFKLRNDPRVTRLGRVLRASSIDELPQLFNVLGGQMSLVGPRPIVTAEIGRYAPYDDDLLRVLPGMTGLWQVNGRSHTTYARRVYFDVKYGDTCSLREDIAILLETIPAVLFRRGAH
jgi:lipopolysaccharide/colanic/teichoic acid biosynthesis glycosyltransferase